MKKATLAVLIISTVFNLMGFAPRAIDQREISPVENSGFHIEGNRRISYDDGRTLALYQIKFQADSNTPENMARQFLNNNYAEFGMTRDLSNIKFSSVRSQLGRHTVRFEQIVNGIEVDKSCIDVTINQRNQIVFVISGYKPVKENQLFTQSISISETEAIQTAADHLNFGSYKVKDVKPVIYYVDASSVIMQKVRISEDVGNYSQWEVYVNAVSGEIYKAKDVSNNIDGTGNVFDPEPVTAGSSEYGETGYTDSNDADNDILTGHVSTKNLPDISFSNNNYYLSNSYAVISDFESPNSGTFEQTSSDFLYTRGDDDRRFEATTVFYHLQESMRYLNEDLGFEVMPTQYTGGIHYDPDGLSGDLNAHYTWDGEIAFGNPNSYVDLAEDNAIVLHELGHGVHDWITGNQLSQEEGLSEGCGDFWAQSYNRSFNPYPPEHLQYDWFGVWGGMPGFSSADGNHLRTTGSSKHYPEDLVNQVHADGEIWSSSLMAIYDGIADRHITNTIFWAGIATLNYSSGQVDAAFAVRQADFDLYEGAHLEIIDDAFIARGYYVDPNIPIGLTAFAGEGVVELSWTAPTSEADSYNIYRDSEFYVNVLVSSFSDFEVVNGTTYTYYVTSLNDQTESGVSNTVEATPLQIIWTDTFEDDLGWELTGEFERGIPDGLGGDYGNPDPETAYQGENVLGSDLVGMGAHSGDYETNLGNDAYAATSPIIDCTIYTDIKLNFMRWLNVERDDYDNAYIKVFDGTNWQTIWENSNATIQDDNWINKIYDVSEYADGNADFRIRYSIGSTDQAWQYCGWNIDNIYIQGIAQQNLGSVSGNIELVGGEGNITDVEILVGQYNTNPDIAGNYLLQIPSGMYEITASLFGFETTSLADVEVLANEETEANMSLYFMESPQNLTAEVTDNNVELNWEIPATNLNLTQENDNLLNSNLKQIDRDNRVQTGYKIFRDNEEIVAVNDIDVFTYTDEELENGDYEYYVIAVYETGESEPSDTVDVTVDYVSAGNAVVPELTALNGNYPNPFNPDTTIRYQVSKAGKIKIVIFNLKGQIVKTLVDAKMKSGYHIVEWNGNDDFGNSVSSGIYFYKMNTDEYSEMKKMILMK